LIVVADPLPVVADCPVAGLPVGDAAPGNASSLFGELPSLSANCRHFRRTVVPRQFGAGGAASLIYS
jgi:hypothetical protein